MAAGATINVANLGEAQIHDAIVATIEATDNFGESKQKLHTAYLTALYLVLVIKYTMSSICESRFTDIQSRASGARTAFHVYDDVWGVVYQDDKGKRSNEARKNLARLHFFLHPRQTDEDHHCILAKTDGLLDIEGQMFKKYKKILVIARSKFCSGTSRWFATLSSH